jgi:aminomethyltransferase
MGLRTPLYPTHIELGAKIVDFGGWDMPLHYGSQIQEHFAVRQDAGMFDVSHMCVIDVTGSSVRDCLRSLLANDIDKLKTSGKALYTCMLLPTGGVIDDLIVYRMAHSWYRLVVNAGTRDKDLAWIRQQTKSYEVVAHARPDLALIAVQGPNARAKTAAILDPAYRAMALELKPFSGATLGSSFVARTGYTGEDGFEIMLPANDAPTMWAALSRQGVAAAGLGARDTLRLEAGMNLYGSDMDESRNPLESGLAWTVAFDPGDRAFIGRDALEAARLVRGSELVGLVLEERAVLRSHQTVIVHNNLENTQDSAGAPTVCSEMDNFTTGEVTSGTFSPTLNCAIALARVPSGAGPRVQVDIRGKLYTARVVKPPFVRHGKSLI